MYGMGLNQSQGLFHDATRIATYACRNASTFPQKHHTASNNNKIINVCFHSQINNNEKQRYARQLQT